MRKRLLIPRKRAYSVPAPEGAHPIGIFGPEHGLTPTQARLAERLLNRAYCNRGSVEGWRLALRVAGIVSAVLGGRVGNGKWGRSMLGTKGGQALARYAPRLLKKASERGVLMRQANAEMRRKYRGLYE